jgi:hypothetical protein
VPLQGDREFWRRHYFALLFAEHASDEALRSVGATRLESGITWTP